MKTRMALFGDQSETLVELQGPMVVRSSTIQKAMCVSRLHFPSNFSTVFSQRTNIEIKLKL